MLLLEHITVRGVGGYDSGAGGGVVVLRVMPVTGCVRVSSSAGADWITMPHGLWRVVFGNSSRRRPHRRRASQGPPRS